MNQSDIDVFDGLLYYLSHAGELRWERFKDAINSLTRDNPGFKFSYLISIERLGHVDYDPMTLDKVVIAPPVLVETAAENRYVLVGSRTPDFIEEVKQCVSTTRGQLRLIPEQHAPTTIMLNELTDASFTEIERLGIHISRAFSARLSSVLPTPTRASFPQDETSLQEPLNKFNPDTLEYEPDNYSLRNDGLYEIPNFGRNVYILKSGSDQRRVPRDWGEWLVLSTSGRTTGLISYDGKSETWRVKSKLLVPLITNRCASLCSDSPPKLKRGFVCYSDVPVGIAYQLTKSLYQDWEVV